MLGVFTAFISNGLVISALFLFCLMCAYLAFWIFTKEKLYKTIFICGIFVLLGMFRGDFAHQNVKTNQAQNFLNQYLFLSGVVGAEPKQTDKGMRMEVDVTRNENKNISLPKVLVGYEGYESFHYGDKVKVRGVLEKPEAFDTSGGSTFNYPMYLAKDGIYFIIQKAKVEKVGEGGGNFLINILYKTKREFVSRMGKVLDTGDTALMSGILLGSQDTISQKIKDDFRNSGLMHIMVLSGYNITVVGEAVSRTTNIWFSKFVSLGFGGFAIILFALLSGGGASTIRSTIMALIAILGKILGREYDALRALFLVGFIMILINPLTLLYDPSFHLSFLATLGMILLSNKIELRLVKLIKFASLREILATTIAVQLFVIPYFLWSMGSVSVISFVANIFVLPVVPATMFFGFLTGLFGFISTYLSLIPGFISHILLLYITKGAEFFASLPFAVWKL